MAKHHKEIEFGEKPGWNENQIQSAFEWRHFAIQEIGWLTLTIYNACIQCIEWMLRYIWNSLRISIFNKFSLIR